MICQSCRDATDRENPELHDHCTNNALPEGNNSNCDCHHRVGTLRYIQEPTVKRMIEEGRPIIPTQEPRTP